ncbi:sulfatase family protein [Maribellus maritimus]|uniref:sulfatase family protein n=1 Tax=Maribellus maritimus TaxID=2870838 RepID=UPI001EEC16D8|nr:sulfatase [Maribellus maritimus]
MNIKKTRIMLLVCFLLFFSTLLQAQERPNILWINCDDLGIELGCYGNKDVKTPNIDQLAEQGVLYENCYATAPVCSPSRSSLITGMYPSAINCLNHRTMDKMPLPEGIKPITEYFKEAGYFCTNGKATDMTKWGKTDFNFETGNLFDGTDWNQRAEGQPFFAQVQIFEPHREFYADKENPISPESVDLPDCYLDHPLIRADWALYLETVQHCDQRVGHFLTRLENEGLTDNTIIVLFGDNGRPHLRDKQFLYEGGLRVPLIIRYPKHFEAGKICTQLVSLVDVPVTSLAFANIPVSEHLQGKVFIGDNAEKREYVLGFRQRMGDAVDNSRSIMDGRYKLIWNKMPEVPWMQLSGYKKLEYPAYSIYKLFYQQGKLFYPYSLFMADSKPEIELYDIKMDPMEFENLADYPKYESIKKTLFSTLKSRLSEIEKGEIPERWEVTKKAKESSAKYYESSMRRRGLGSDSSYEDIIEYWEKKLSEKN